VAPGGQGGAAEVACAAHGGRGGGHPLAARGAWSWPARPAAAWWRSARASCSAAHGGRGGGRRAQLAARRRLPRAAHGTAELDRAARNGQGAQHPPHAREYQIQCVPARDPHPSASREADSYNGSAGDSASEHGPTPSPREATGQPSASPTRVYFAKTVTKRRGKRRRCTCPKASGGSTGSRGASSGSRP